MKYENGGTDNISQLSVYFMCFAGEVHLHLLQTSLLTYIITPRIRVLLEKLTGSQLVKKFPAFYGTRRFITTFTSARRLSLS